MSKSKYNFTFFQDLLKEKRGGKFSSKKIWGAIVMLLLCLAFIGDGFEFYKVNVELFNTFAIIGTTLIGLGSAVAAFTKKNTGLALSDEKQQ